MIDNAAQPIAEDTIEDRIKSALVAGLELKVDPRSIPTDMPLVEKGLGLDSLSILQLIGFIEEEFAIRIQDSDISRDLFRDVRSLGGYVRARLAEVEAA